VRWLVVPRERSDPPALRRPHELESLHALPLIRLAVEQAIRIGLITGWVVRRSEVFVAS
jgi:hypothetical protein